MTLTADETAARYELLCRSTRATPAEDPLALRLAPLLARLDALVQHDLRELGRQGSPDDFADICFELAQELERFRAFCAFPALAQKFVVAFGGAFSAGKSSLINTLLGRRLLVTEVDPTTSLPTYLLQGDENTIHAHNQFGHRITLSEEEFLSLTHDETERWGSNISRLLQSAIVSRQDFPWRNLALIDTPGYTKPDDRHGSARTDEHLARTQLNSAQAIVWVIDARQGAITEADIAFLATLRPDIPRLLVLSRADQKPPEDVAGILAGIRATLEARNLPFLDVVPVSARKKEWPPTQVQAQLSDWDGAGRELRFAHNFKQQFTRYARYLEDERRQAQQHLNRLNRILALADEAAVQQDAQELKRRAEGVLQRSERLYEELAALRQRFFGGLKAIGDSVGMALPEPSALELLDDGPGFDLLRALRQRREAEGATVPEEPATLHELTLPGDMPKLGAFLNGEAAVTDLATHRAAKLDAHGRESYARFVAALMGHGKPALTEVQSRLYLKLLESLQLSDRHTVLLAQARQTTGDDVQEGLRTVAEHGLANSLFFDALMLCRSAGPLDREQIQLLVELATVLGLEAAVVRGFPALAGYVLGLHERSEYTAPVIAELEAWMPLLLKRMEVKDISDGKITGYYLVERKITGTRQYLEKISMENAFVIFNNLLQYSAARPIRVSIKNCTLWGADFEFGHSWNGIECVEIENSSFISSSMIFRMAANASFKIVKSNFRNTTGGYEDSQIKIDSPRGPSSLEVVDSIFSTDRSCSISLGSFGSSQRIDIRIVDSYYSSTHEKYSPLRAKYHLSSESLISVENSSHDTKSIILAGDGNFFGWY